MKFLLWEKRFETGFPEIDDRHKHEFDLVNRVHAAVVEEHPREQIADAMVEFITDVEEHFTHEEQVMEQLNYPNLAHHQEEHQRLLNKLREYHTMFEAGDMTPAYDLLEFAHSWFIRHLENQDRELGEFLLTSEMQ